MAGMGGYSRFDGKWQAGSIAYVYAAINLKRFGKILNKFTTAVCMGDDILKVRQNQNEYFKNLTRKNSHLRPHINVFVGTILLL